MALEIRWIYVIVALACIAITGCGDDSQSRANLKRSLDWLAANSLEPGVTTTPSGLQYRFREQADGDGPAVIAGQFVCVHAEGKLVDDTVFWGQLDPDPAIAFASDAVIKGWQEGLQLMRPGDEIELFIPPDLGYGNKSPGGDIGPNDALIFTVKLYGVQSEPYAENADCRDGPDKAVAIGNP